MAAGNVELVRSIYAAWERDDYSSIEWAHPEIEFVLVDGPDPGSWRGQAGMVEGWRAFLSNWGNYRIDVEEYREVDAERILVLLRIAGSGKTSGLDLGQMRARGANIVQLRGGKVVRLALYFDRDRALADLEAP
ncbi:MAG TPA: nuclear transport factor 2 family protein [Thermoleophilaceae bacterium]|jgi:ketosteroid isomerase-like protein